MKQAVCLLIFSSIATLALGGQTITVTSPAVGNTWANGQTQNIVWTKSGNMDTRVLIRLRQGDSALMTLSADTGNDGSFSWAIPTTVLPGQYYIRVRTLDGAVKGDSGTFTIAPALPPPPPPPPASLMVTSPNGGETWALGTDRVITWNAVNVPGKVRVELVKDQGPMMGIIFNDLAPYAGSHAWGAGKYGLNQTAPPGEYRIVVRSLSNFQLSDQSDQPFTLKFRMTAPRKPVTLSLAKPDLVACTETAVYVPLKTLGWFHVYVRNVGKGTAKAPFEVEIFMAGHTPFRQTIDADLAPGQTRWVINISDSKLRQTTIGFMVTADPDNHVAESNEENNRANGLLIIEDGNPTDNTPIRCGDGSTV